MITVVLVSLGIQSRWFEVLPGSSVIVRDPGLDVRPARDGGFVRICHDIDERDAVQTDHFLEVNVPFLVAMDIVC